MGRKKEDDVIQVRYRHNQQQWEQQKQKQSTIWTKQNMQPQRVTFTQETMADQQRTKHNQLDNPPVNRNTIEKGQKEMRNRMYHHQK